MIAYQREKSTLWQHQQCNRCSAHVSVTGRQWSRHFPKRIILAAACFKLCNHRLLKRDKSISISPPVNLGRCVQLWCGVLQNAMWHDTLLSHFPVECISY